MCRVSSPPSAVVPLNPDLLLARHGTKIFPATDPTPAKIASKNRYRHVCNKAKELREPLPSILRKSSYEGCPATMRGAANPYSTLPKLVAVNDGTDALLNVSLSRESSTESIKSDTSFEEQCLRKVSFHNKVVVQEFQRLPGEEKTTWYNHEDMKAFHREVARLVRQYDRTHWMGFFTRKKNRTLHSHPALTAEVEDDDDDGPNALTQVKKILLVDSHDLSLKLFAQAFQRAFPHAVVLTACGSQDALDLLTTASAFDVVVVEERLSLFHNQTDSGSGLMKVLRQTMPRSLFIGVSAHMNRDQAALKESGAELCWSKPPPPLSKSTVDEIFQTLLRKRSGHT